MKNTAIIGASDNPERYSFKAAKLLTSKGHPIILYGNRPGKIADSEINTSKPETLPNNIDTVTLYVNPLNQKPWYELIINSNPKRVIFNPGTENREFENLLSLAQIDFEHSCTLVLLNTGQY